MQRIASSRAFPAHLPQPVVALGNFDGVHLGHRRLIELAIDEARLRSGTSVVYTFSPHPVRLLAPAECPPLLQSDEQRLASIEKLGPDCTVVEPFTPEFAAMGAEGFFQEILVGRLHAAALVAGYDFTFGLHRKGSAEELKRLGQGRAIAVHILEAQFAGETLISSTNIRRLLEEGEVAEAAALLGRPYAIEGRVVAGRGLGRELGARTANIASAGELIPPSGVYFTRTRFLAEGSERELRFPSITSIGANPTFPGSPFTIETHLLDAEPEVAGRRAIIEFLERVREQIAFPSARELKEQILRDLEVARRWHAQRGCG